MTAATGDQNTLPTFDAFRSEPLLLGPLDDRSRAMPPAIASLSLLVGAFVLLAVNLSQGTVGSLGWDQWTADVSAAWTGRQNVLSRSTDFGLLRDTPSLIAGAVALLTPALVAVQWHAMRAYVRDLFCGGLLFDPSCDSAWYQREIERQNTILDRYKRQTPWMIFLAAAAALLIVRAQRSVGVFGALGDSKGYPLEAYAGWWANQDDHYAGFAAYLLITAVFLYFVLVQNRAGWRLVMFMFTQRERLHVGFDITNADGAYGWLPMRKLLRTVYLSLSLHLGAILVLAFTIRPDAFTRWLLPITLLYLAVVPLYVVLPLFLFGSRRRKRKLEVLEELSVQLHTALGATSGAYRAGEDPSPHASMVSVVQWQMAEVRRVPLTPFRAREVVIGVVLYTVPAAAAIIQSFDIVIRQGG